MLRCLFIGRGVWGCFRLWDGRENKREANKCVERRGVENCLCYTWGVGIGTLLGRLLELELEL